MEQTNPNAQKTARPFVDEFIDAAELWFASGLAVIPLLQGTLTPAVPIKQVVDVLAPLDIEKHLWRHPEHDLGFVVTDSLIVISAASERAQAAFNAVMKRFSIEAKTVMQGSESTEYHFWLAKGTAIGPAMASNPDHKDRIGVSTGNSILSLPPTIGKTVLVQASNTGDYMKVTQSVIDAIFDYNNSLPLSEFDRENAAQSEAAPTISTSIKAVSEITSLTIGGEAGIDALQIEPSTASTPLAAFLPANPLSNQSVHAQDAAVPAAPQDSPSDGTPKEGEGGKGGVAQEVAAEGITTALPVTRVGPIGVPDSNDVMTPKALVNPVVQALQARGHYITPLGSGAHRITCPFGHEHGDGSLQDATYVEPDEFSSTGVFHCDDPLHIALTITELLENLGVAKMDARNKPVIRVIPGELHSVVDAAERQLAIHGKHFQHGGFIVSVTTDPATGNPTIVPSNVQSLTRELSVAATWEKQDGRNDGWVPCDPPARPIAILHNATDFRHLPVLAGVARQPYFAPDGTLVSQPGYSAKSKVFSVFDPAAFAMPAPTLEAAREALALLEGLNYEFHFANPWDKAGMVSAQLTAAVRFSLRHAPAIHFRARDIASGKTYGCELVSCFASPAPSEKVSYPTTSEEATKVILSLLMKGPAVVEFDDMDSDWLPHGSLKRMLTAEFVTDRILGYSKTATVSTKALFLGSGNNVGPIGDMRRRVVTINLDPECDTPATITYKNNPVATVKQNRGKYVAAALTIIAAWRAAGCPRANVSPIATYGMWSDYCREPLIWLGYPDPATSLLDQVQNDPDSDPLLGLLTAWWGVFRSAPVPLRKALEVASSGEKKLLDAFHETPAEERGSINRTKLGWFLKKNAGRIVGGMKLVETSADGRKGWMVVMVNAQKPASLDDDTIY